MDVLVVGGGGREHALVQALDRSPSVDKIFCAPGNAGIARLAECLDINVGDLDGIARAADERAVDLVVVGPEAPLTAGISAILEQFGIACFGPSAAAAILEGSKAFSKAFMERHGIPTAAFRVFNDPTAALEFVAAPEWGFPIVVKADGLAAGKGVLICEDSQSASDAIRLCMEDAAFGTAGATVVVEQCLRGVETTVMALTDGERLVVLPPSQDHKQAFDGDQGPNTGGMGAFAPAENVIDSTLLTKVRDEVLVPTINGMNAEDRRFQGVLYAGLMLTDDGPYVLEFNCRFGDPEAEVVLPLIRSDVGELLSGIAEGRVPDQVEISDEHAAIVVLAAEGYPGKHRHGDVIDGLAQAEAIEAVAIIHCGTTSDGDKIVTSGGRVLGVTATGCSRDEALRRAYAAVEQISFPGMHFRRDIGRRDQE
ncbi:MAG: phosphoribosylamine--glycine ligase [Acidobacteria bacterium]|nr:phosphoribosylamine--glycine ligase [Acidobacteriota bacterium]